uniref:DUF5641 domain-containing protein n=1 Tax=Steinernema glaseri TaxID=37863 RepID=A0A1I7YLP0_9BILA
MTSVSTSMNGAAWIRTPLPRAIAWNTAGETRLATKTSHHYPEDLCFSSQDKVSQNRKNRATPLLRVFVLASARGSTSRASEQSAICPTSLTFTIDDVLRSRAWPMAQVVTARVFRRDMHMTYLMLGPCKTIFEDQRQSEKRAKNQKRRSKTP